jgi:hypothetical protein
MRYENAYKKEEIIMARTPKEINWDLVDNLLMAGCSGPEIAPHFDIHYETLYDRTVKEFGMSYTQYSQRLRQKGDALLKAKQYAKALGQTETGDNTLLIWLGKNRLGQKENQENNITPNDKALTELISEIKSMKEKFNATES